MNTKPRSILFTCIFTFLVATAVHAAVYTWDSNTGAVGAQDGAGSWNTSGTNWLSGGSNVVFGNTSSDTAAFGAASGTAGTITVSTITANAIAFNAAGSGTYTLSSGTITLAGTSPTIAANVNATIGSVLAGTVGLTSTGAGALTLSGANTYSAGTTVTSGTLTVANAQALGSPSGALYVASGGGFAVNAPANTGLAWAYYSATPGTQATFAGSLTGIQSVVSGTTPTSVTNVTSLGSLPLATGTSCQAIGSGMINIATSGTYVFQRTSQDEDAAIFIDGQAVVPGVPTSNPSPWTQAATSGTIVLSSGFHSIAVPWYQWIGGEGLQIQWKGPDTSNTLVNLATANANLTPDQYLASLIGSGNVALNTGNLVVGYGNTSGPFGGVISGIGGVTKYGAGTLTLTGSNTYTGVTTISAGTLQIGDGTTDGSIATSGTIANNAALVYNLVGNQSLGGIISGSGSLTKTGAGALTLANANTFTGDTVIAGGTLVIGGSTSLQNSTLNYNNQGGALSFGSWTAATLGGLKGAQSLSLLNTGGSGVALSVGNNNQNTTFTGTITGSSASSFIKIGTGTSTLDSGASTANTFGSMTANGGNLILKSGTYTNSGTDPAVSAYAVGVGARGGTLTINGAVLTDATGYLKFGAAANGNVNILSGTVSTPSDFVLGHNGSTVGTQSGGSVTAATIQHYDGGTASYTLTGGTLNTARIYNHTSVASSFTLNLNGGTLQAAAGTTNLIDNGGGAGGPGSEIAVFLGAGNTVIDTTASSATIIRPMGDMSGQAGTFTKAGANTLTLSATNSYTGATAINAGTLLVNGPITQTSSLSINSNATLQIGLRAPNGIPAINVKGNVTLAGQISVSDLGIVANTTYPVISYTGQLTNNGITVALNMSQWAFTIDTSVPHVVSLVVGQKYPLVQFSSTSSVVTSLTTNLYGTLPGTMPTGDIWYEVRDQANKLWDFGATQARTPWSITVRHLRSGTNTVTVFAKDTTGAIQSNSIQLTLNLGANTPVRPRPIPSEIWWGGCSDNSQMTNYSQWPFVQKYEDGYFFHAYYWMTTAMISSGSAAALEQSLATNLLPFNTKYWVELAGDIPSPSTTSAASQLSSAGGSAAVCEANGIIWSEFTHDYHMEDLQPLCQVNPTWQTNDQIAWWTGDLTIASGTYPYTSGIWRDVFNGYYAMFPHVKVGHTSQPEYWPWDSYPAELGNDLPFSPQTAHDVIGSFVNMAGAIGHPYFSLQSDAPWDFFGGTQYNGVPRAPAADEAVMRQKIRVYEQYLQSRNCRHTLICNVSDATRGRLGSYDASDIYYENSSLSSMVLHQQEGGRANRYLFEDWYPTKSPYAVVPETKVGSYTHLALSGIKYLKGIADINGNLEPLNITPTATNGTVVQLQLQNNGDVMCLPALAGQVGTVPGVTTRYFTTSGTEVTATVLTAEGLCYTNMLQPGATTNLFAVTLASGISATTSDNASLEAFWNPQDPLGIVRDRASFATPLNPLGSWQDADIGSVGLPGGSALSGTNFTLLGSGADIADIADAFHFVWQTKSGDGTLTARVTSQTAADVWSKAGVMIRESTASGARNVCVCVTPGNGVSFQNRAVSGGTTSTTSLAGMVAPYWVRLTCSGTTFTALCSANGVDWVTVGSCSLTGFVTSAQWGLAVTAHNNALASAATFDNVTLSNTTTNAAPVLNPIANCTLIAGQTLTFTNVATDADVPLQTLTFSLIAPPPGATVDSSRGVFNWRPTIAQSPATYLFSVTVTDNGTPSLSATQSFVVTVTAPATPMVSGVKLVNGQFSMTIGGDNGPDYTIFASPNLIDWMPIQVTSSPTPPFTFTDPDAVNFQKRFYRVRLGP